MSDTITVVNQTSISSEAVFYTVKDVQELTGWSFATVQKLFNTKDFPSCNFGRHKLVESHALISYFGQRRLKETDRFWNEEAKQNEQKPRRTRYLQRD